MALTIPQPTTEITMAPNFELLNPLAGSIQGFENLKGDNATVVVFMCNHCPYVKHILPKLLEVALEFKLEGVNFIGINSNNAELYPEDSPENMAKIARELNFPFPYLFDETQSVAKAFGAECTPEFFVFDNSNTLYYHGRFDETNHKTGKQATGSDLKSTLNCLLVGKKPDFDFHPSLGCSIKWK